MNTNDKKWNEHWNSYFFEFIINLLYRDAIIISVLDTFTSLLAGCVIFSVLGTMANEKGVEIKDVVSSGMCNWIE